MKETKKQAGLAELIWLAAFGRSRLANTLLGSVASHISVRAGGNESTIRSTTQ